MFSLLLVGFSSGSLSACNTRAALLPMTDDALGGLADSVACSLVEKFPGADIHTLPRTAGMPVAMAGLTLSALAETLLLYVDHGRADSIAEAPLRELTVMLSLLGFSLLKVTGRRSPCRRVGTSACAARWGMTPTAAN
jgi:hypothetical protein